MPEEQCKKVLAGMREQKRAARRLKKERKEARRRREKTEVDNQIKRAIAAKALKETEPVYIELPKLKIGRRYRIMGTAHGMHKSRYTRTGKILKHYPYGSYYLVDYGPNRETVSQSDLLTGEEAEEDCR